MNAVLASLSPAVHAWAARIASLSAELPGLTGTDLPSRRAAERLLSDALAREFTAEAPTRVRIATEDIDTPIGPRRVRRYRPDAMDGTAPAQLFLHGGGFVSGSADELVNDRLLAARAADAGIQVISLDYRLAPEHPYPAAVEDAIAVLDALRARPDRYGVDVSRIGIGGASAGGGIAASTALHLRERGDHVLVHQALEVPALAMTPFGASAAEYARGFGLDGYERLAALYLGPDGTTAPFAAPLDAADLTGLPPTLIRVAEHDPLRDAALAYGARLAAAGVPTITEIGHGHVHGSPGLTATFEPARTWQHRVAAALRDVYHAPGAPGVTPA
ncbi:alpha/beta hydrolase fold domain-containing protein [Streptosporangium longisporum]|uniref:Acylcarnitine hydrolase n=1 Tax=Streptosporangium longisporum TaxID=46187 RepID=A0ABN3Y6A5_9ACTN